MSETNKRPTDGEAPATGENLEKVRDILFGTQMRESDKRFARIEERLAKELTDLRDENRRRLDTLEGYIKKEIQSLLERVKSEANQRNESVRGLSQELKEATKEIDRRVTELDGQTAETHRGIRQELLDQSNTLRDEIRHGAQDLSTSVSQAIGEVRAEKADRSALADLFTEMAMRLTADETETGG